MITSIKQERFDDFKAHAFEYGFVPMSNQWVDTHSSKAMLFVKENGELYAFVDGAIVTDVPHDYIPNLVWDGLIKKY